MFYNTNTSTLINQLPAQHRFSDGRLTGDFNRAEQSEYIAEGFLPFEEIYPEYNEATEVIEAGDIVIAEDGESASRTWTARDKTTEELAADLASAWADIRAERNRLLTESDWTQVTDSPFYQDEDWLDYRQALRDLPETYETPSAVVYPTLPGA